MSTFANALKDEVRRLARKEIRVQTSRLSKAVAQYRREIARLKRQLRDHEKRIAALRAKPSKQSETPAESTNGHTRFSARSVRAQRQRTGLSAADYAKLVGVSPLTIYNWEHGKSRPRSNQFAALVALRGIGKRQARAKLAQHATTNGKSPSRRSPRQKSS